MTKFLQELLTNNEPLFSRSLSELERSTGHESVDVRLIADITHGAHNAMRQLGLDTADTTARELYLALNSYVVREDHHELLFATDFVLINIDGQIVSFNLIDVVESSHHQLLFEDRIISHGQRALRGEIITRYLAHPQTNDETTNRLAIDAGLVEESDTHYAATTNALANKQRGDAVDAPYILAIGDIFTDDFIELDPEEAIAFKDENEVSHLMMPFGSKPPYLGAQKITSVGPSPNAAVSFARLGVNTDLRAFLGDDETGKESLGYLKSEGVDTTSMSVQKDRKSNYYYVLRLGADRTILVKNEDYDYTWVAPERTPDWVYLSLLSKDSWQLHEDLLAYLQANPDIKLAFQPGTFHFSWGVQKLAGIYGRSYIVVMNREEAVDVTGKSYDSLQDLCNGLHELGPEIVVITDGPNGSYASRDGKIVSIPNYPDPAPPFDRTGAGDAFASTIVAVLALGESLETALTWAPINSMNVVQKLGAQAGLLHRDEFQQYLDSAPEDYKATELQS